MVQGIVVFKDGNLSDHIDIMLLPAKSKGIITGIQTFKGEIIFLIGGIVILFIKIWLRPIDRVGVGRAKFILVLILLLLIISTYHSIDIWRLILNSELLLLVLLLFFEISKCSVVSVIESIGSRTAVDLLNLAD